MPSTVFRKNFQGLHISVQEILKHPCPKNVLAEHFNVGYRLMQFHITNENPFLHPGFTRLKLVNVKPTWNIVLRNVCTESVMVVEREEVIVDIQYTLGKLEGAPADMITLLLRSLSDGLFSYRAVYIKHPARSSSPT